MKIDNHALQLWQTCPAKHDLSIRKGWQPRFRGGAVGYGAAVHEGLATWYKVLMDNPKASVPDRLAAAKQSIINSWPENQPTDDFRTMSRACELMDKYADTYPFESFKPVLVEQPFSFETGMYLDCPACGESRAFPNDGRCENCLAQCESIEYGGIVDLLVEFNGVYFIVDHKTTSQLGPMYFLQYKPNNQLTGYCWGIQQATGKHVSGAFINALCTTISGKISFKRELTNRSPNDIELWLRQLRSECNSIRRHELTGEFPYHTAQCMGKYGICEYHSVHVLSDPSEQQSRLETDFEVRQWNFELRDTEASTS